MGHALRCRGATRDTCAWRARAAAVAPGAGGGRRATGACAGKRSDTQDPAFLPQNRVYFLNLCADGAWKQRQTGGNELLPPKPWSPKTISCSEKRRLARKIATSGLGQEVPPRSLEGARGGAGAGPPGRGARDHAGTCDPRRMGTGRRADRAHPSAAESNTDPSGARLAARMLSFQNYSRPLKNYFSKL